MACPCKMTSAKIVLLILNICLAIISLFLFIAGCVLVSGKSAYSSQLGFLRDHLDKASTAIGAIQLDEGNLDIDFITYPMGVAFIVVSLLTEAIAAFGIVVAVRQSDVMLVVYSVILVGLFFAESVLIMCAYIDKQPFENNVKKMLKDSLADFTGIDGEDSLTLGWNAIMSYKRCCGVDGYEDFQVATNWQKSINGGGTFSNVVVPFICCIDPSQTPTCARPASFESQTFYDKGCYENIWDLAISDNGSVLCFIFFLMVTKFMCLFMAVWNICKSKSNNPASTKVVGLNNH